jgi:GDPmannose 4,6-dehydratase
MKKKRAFITGISGQDGAYLSKLLIDKGYKITGGVRRNASGNLWRLEELGIDRKVKVVSFDLLEEGNVIDVVKKGKYDEIYNLAAQSFVGYSYDNPLVTSNINGLGVARFLEAIRLFSPKTKFYQASTSEMFGKNSRKQNETTNFLPVSPYAISKLYSHWMINLYRDAYGIFCCAGILFNHESPLRGEEFVTRKIVSELAKVKAKKIPYLELGNIYSRRDWGYAMDYVEAMWKMMQKKTPDDYVISSGITHTVKEFVNRSAQYFGYNIEWRGKGLKEVGYDKKTSKIIVKISKKYFRPTEVNLLIGDSTKARKSLKWKPKTGFNELVRIMCEAELKKQTS